MGGAGVEGRHGREVSRVWKVAGLKGPSNDVRASFVCPQGFHKLGEIETGWLLTANVAASSIPFPFMSTSK